MRIIYLGFFKLTLLNTPLAYNDGDKMIQVKFDYCSFSSGTFSIRLSNKIKYHIITDWSAKEDSIQRLFSMKIIPGLCL